MSVATKRLRFLFLSVLGLSCPTTLYFPGRELIGTFNFNATPRSNGCPFVDVSDAGFTFTGTFSYNPDGSTYFTLGRIDQAVRREGPYLVSESRVSRQFPNCACSGGALSDETLRVYLLGTGESCPLDGGVPPLDVDVLASLPRGTKACGDLTDLIIHADSTCTCGPSCTCGPCTVVFDVDGTKQ